MTVSDANKNLLIEARAYGHGYGKLQEIELNNVFDGIETYQDLCNEFFNKKELRRKDSKGIIRDTFTNWNIVTMKSAYK